MLPSINLFTYKHPNHFFNPRFDMECFITISITPWTTHNMFHVMQHNLQRAELWCWNFDVIERYIFNVFEYMRCEHYMLLKEHNIVFTPHEANANVPLTKKSVFIKLLDIGSYTLDIRMSKWAILATSVHGIPIEHLLVLRPLIQNISQSIWFTRFFFPHNINTL